MSIIEREGIREMLPNEVTPGQLLNILLPIFKIGGRQLPSVMLWGEPGIGKSESVKNIAAKLEEETGKTAVITDVRLLLFNPVDLRGVPIPDEERKATKWLIPKIFQMDADPQVINILMLDELTAAPPSLQAAAYQLILDRRVGEHELPGNCIVIAAGNRVQDKGVAYQMPTPLANRMTHFHIKQDVEDWLKFAVKPKSATDDTTKIHPMVRGFLRFRGSDHLLNFNPKVENVAFPTPRTWEFVSRYLDLYESVEAAIPAIYGTVGQTSAQEFVEFSKVYKDLPKLDLIRHGLPTVPLQNRMDVVCALASQIISNLRTFSDEEIINVYHYILDAEIEVEYMMILVRDMFHTSRGFAALSQSERLTEFVEVNRKYL
jgi:hypothetical protein